MISGVDWRERQGGKKATIVSKRVRVVRCGSAIGTVDEDDNDVADRVEVDDRREQCIDGEVTASVVHSVFCWEAISAVRRGNSAVVFQLVIVSSRKFKAIPQLEPSN